MKELNFLHPITITLMLLIFPICINAQSRSWDGGAGTESWHDAMNWNPDGMPTAEEVIELPMGIGTVQINSNAFAHAITLQSGTQLIVNVGGHLMVDGASNGVGVNVFSGAILRIDGAVTITGSGITSDALKNAGQTQVAGVLSITGPTHFSGIYNVATGTLNNSGTGQITISETTPNGIENLGEMENIGTIMINNVSDNGIYNHGNTASFNNAGTLQITQAGDNGIYNANESSFLNYFLLTIDNIGGFGIKNESALFVQFDRALLEIGQSATIVGAAIVNTSNGSDLNFFNDGHIKIGEGAQVGSSAVIQASAGLMSNGACGLIQIYTTNVTNIQTDDRSFLTNNGVFITNGTPNNATLNNDDGIIYNLGSGTFPAETNGTIENNLPTTTDWTGCGFSSDWNNPNNWLLKELPTATQSVQIPNPTRGQSVGSSIFPQLSSGTVNIRSLFVNSAAAFTIGTNAALNIDGQ